MNVQISNLGRIKEDTIKKIKGVKSSILRDFTDVYPTVKDIILKLQGTDEATTVFDNNFNY